MKQIFFFILTLLLVGCEVERQYIYLGKNHVIDTHNMKVDSIKVEDLFTGERKVLPDIYEWYVLPLHAGDTITFFPKRWMVYKSSRERYVLNKKEIRCGCGALYSWKITP